MNLMDVNREFRTEEDCLEELAKVRWPDGVRCPTCGCKDVSHITRKPTSKNKRTRSYQCLEKTCNQQFTATHGTMFYRSHIPLRVWFNAIAFVMDAKKGCSAMQLQRHLGLGSYESAWYMVHRIRKSMVDTNPAPLTGIIEVDETYVGGRSKRRGGSVKNQKPIAEKFDMVLGMHERKGRVKFVHVPDGRIDTIRRAVEKYIVPFPYRIYTDSAAVYDFALNPELKKSHRSVNHSIEWVVPGSKIHTNNIESAFGLFKRGIVGSFHHVSTKHLWRYLEEFSYRANLRNDVDKFGKTLKAMLATPTMPYKELIASVPASEF